MTTQTGGCACGAIRFEIDADPVFQFACHCLACQKSNGGAPTYGFIAPKAGVKLTKGSPRTYWSEGDSGGKVGRQFCETCGSPLFSEIANMPVMLGVKAGALDDAAAFKPQAHIWTESAQPWHTFQADLPRMPRNPG
ncbi:MAG TPA: GFA family protein [Caulobacteraceae bacterium]|jgi:hypothetical protein